MKNPLPYVTEDQLSVGKLPVSHVSPSEEYMDPPEAATATKRPLPYVIEFQFPAGAVYCAFHCVPFVDVMNPATKPLGV
jgi:hypothetical protein